jgi:hypothetical protein
MFIVRKIEAAGTNLKPERLVPVKAPWSPDAE